MGLDTRPPGHLHVSLVFDSQLTRRRIGAVGFSIDVDGGVAAGEGAGRAVISAGDGTA